MTVTVAGHTIRRQILEPALEARGANLAEGDLLANPRTPEVDSLAEWITGLRHHGVGSSVIRDGLRYVGQALELNGIEGRHERRIAGAADALTRQAEHHARNGNGGGPTIRSTARALRGALAVIADPAAHDAMAFVAAVRQVDDVIAAMPAAQLLTASMRNQLGAAPYRLLEALHASRTAADAAVEAVA